MFRDPQLAYEQRTERETLVARLLAEQIGRPGILVAQRSPQSHHGAGGWHPIGGKVDKLSQTTLESLYTEVEQELGLTKEDIVISWNPLEQSRVGDYRTQFFKGLIFPEAEFVLNDENSNFEFVNSPLQLLTRPVVFKSRMLLLKYMIERMAVLAEVAGPLNWQDAALVKLFEFLYPWDHLISRVRLNYTLGKLDVHYHYYKQLKATGEDVDAFRPQDPSANLNHGKGLLWQMFAEPLFYLMHSGLNQVDDYRREEWLMSMSLGHLSIGELLRWLEAIERYYPGFTGLPHGEA